MALPRHAGPPGDENRYWVTALIPAYNSADCIGATIQNMRGQTRPPDRIIVVANNCTDNTADIARNCGAVVVEMQHNIHKKAGALNHALQRILPSMTDRDILLIQDDDTTTGPDFIRQGMIRLTATRNRAHAVGPVFYGRDGAGVLGTVQRNEYIRFADSALARKGRDVIVLSGTAAMFRADTLQAVSEAMTSGRFDGEGYVYNIHSQTEDHYLTLVLHKLGFRTMAPPECRVVTDVMETPKALWRQRIRWQHGTIDDLRSFGWCPETRAAIIRQTMTALLIVFTFIYPFFLGNAVTVFGWGAINPLRYPAWTACAAFVIFERVWSVRTGGWRSMAVAATIIPEWLYDMFRQAIFLTALAKSIRGRATIWHHT